MISQVAQQFAGPGIVFKIDVHNAKDIQPFSYYGNMEGELLLSANMVSPGPTRHNRWLGSALLHEYLSARRSVI